MPSVTVQRSVAIAGITISQQQSRTSDGTIGFETPTDDLIAAGKAGSLTTRSGNSAGVVTLSTGHGITTGMKVDVFWSGGSRYNCDTSVATNAITLSNGAGDNLPAQGVAVVMSRARSIAVGVDGDAIKVLLAGNNRRCRVDFRDGSGTSLLALDLASGEGYGWVSDSNITNPLAGVTVASAVVSNGDSTNGLNFKLGVIYDTGA